MDHQHISIVLDGLCLDASNILYGRVLMRPQWLNRYGLRIKPNVVLWYINGWDERVLETPHAPYRNPVHFVLQAGVNEHILERMGEDPIGDGFEWERTILFRPVMFPGIHPQFK